MLTLETFFTLSLVVQLIHSIEELSTGFNKKWYLFKMPFWVFLLFEILFSFFWIVVYFFRDFPMRTNFETFFIFLMFANGVQHVVWASLTKKYVPGLVTAIPHIIIFLFFYLKVFLS